MLDLEENRFLARLGFEPLQHRFELPELVFLDNDHIGFATRSQNVMLTASVAVWFEARFRVVESSTNESAWWFGLSNTLTTGGLQANALAGRDSSSICADRRQNSAIHG